MPYKDLNKQKEFHKREYALHKERYSDRNRTRRAERKVWFFETILKGKVCEKCGENCPACLDFHHIDPKTKTAAVSRMINEFRSKESILKEIKKCIIVCANCHRKLHSIYLDQEDI